MEAIIVIGGSNIDIIAKSKNDLIMHDSNIGEAKIFFGGVARNIAENLSRLNNKVTFITAISNDQFGEMLKNNLEELNINYQNSVFSNDRSGIYLAVCDKNGEMKVAICDNDIMKKVNSTFLKEKLSLINEFEYLIIDTNLEDEAIDFIFKNVKAKICVDATSTVKAMKLKPYLNKIHFLKTNLFEAEVLTNSNVNIEKQIDELKELGVEEIVITQGSNDLFFNDGSIIKSKKLKKIDNYVNSTGCGDAFMSGIIHSKLKKMGIDVAIDFAIKLSELTLFCEGACNQDLNKLI